MDFVITSRILTFGISLHRGFIALQLGRFEFTTHVGDDSQGGKRFQPGPSEFSFRLRKTRFYFTKHKDARSAVLGWLGYAVS